MFLNRMTHFGGLWTPPTRRFWGGFVVRWFDNASMIHVIRWRKDWLIKEWWWQPLQYLGRNTAHWDWLNDTPGVILFRIWWSYCCSCYCRLDSYMVRHCTLPGWIKRNHVTFRRFRRGLPTKDDVYSLKCTPIYTLVLNTNPFINFRNFHTFFHWDKVKQTGFFLKHLRARSKSVARDISSCPSPVWAAGLAYDVL